MGKFSVTINESPRHIVSTKTRLLAVKATIEALEETGEMPPDDAALEIRVAPYGANKEKR